MFASVVGFSSTILARMPRRVRRRLDAFGLAAVASITLTFVGLGELFRATLGTVAGMAFGVFLAILHFGVLRIVVAGGGMSLALPRTQAARWRAGRGPIGLFAVIGVFVAQGIVVMALEHPLGLSAGEHRLALFEVRSQRVWRELDDEESALADAERQAVVQVPRFDGTKDPEQEHVADDLLLRRSQLRERRVKAQRELEIYHDHLAQREFEGRRIAEAWGAHFATAAAVTALVAFFSALPAILRVLFRSAFSSYYGRRWEADRRLVLHWHGQTSAKMKDAFESRLWAIAPNGPIPECAPDPYLDPAFKSELRPGHGFLEGPLADTTRAIPWSPRR